MTLLFSCSEKKEEVSIVLKHPSVTGRGELRVGRHVSSGSTATEDAGVKARGPRLDVPPQAVRKTSGDVHNSTCKALTAMTAAWVLIRDASVHKSVGTGAR